MCCWAQSEFPGPFIGFLYLVLGKSPRGMEIAAKSKRSRSFAINSWPGSSRQTGGLPACRSSSKDGCGSVSKFWEISWQVSIVRTRVGREIIQLCWVGDRRAGRKSTPERSEERIPIWSMYRKHFTVTESSMKAYASTQLHGRVCHTCVWMVTTASGLKWGLEKH